jgi:hypothetical protein
MEAAVNKQLKMAGNLNLKAAVGALVYDEYIPYSSGNTYMVFDVRPRAPDDAPAAGASLHTAGCGD